MLQNLKMRDFSGKVTDDLVKKRLNCGYDGRKIRDFFKKKIFSFF